jgi:hypothetical protein
MPIYFKGHRINDVVVGTASGSTAGATLTNASDLRAGLIAYGRYGQITGTMQDLAATTYTPGTTNQTITAGKYIAGAQTILGDANLVAGNIKSGTTIFGVTGSYGGASISLQTKSATPTLAVQTIEPDSGYDGLSSVEIAAMPTGSAGTPTATKGSVSNHVMNITPSVTNVTGYITGGTKNGTAVSVSASELVSGTKSISANGTGIDVTNYASVDVAVPSSGITPTGNLDITSSGVTNVTNYATVTVPNATIDDSGVIWDFKTENNQRVCDIKAGFVFNGGYIDGLVETYGETLNAVPKNTTVTPSTSSQTIGGANYMMEGAVTVEAMPTGTAGTPTATKGAVSNHSISVTPSVTNTSGYITGSTKTGTAVTVTASELASGNKSINSNGTNIDVVGYSTVSVSVPTGSTINNRPSVSVTPSTTSQTIGFDSSTYTGLSEVVVGAIPSQYKNTSDADAVATNLLYGKIAYNSSGKITGSMPNNGATGGTISTQGGTYTIPAGYTSGGTVTATLPTGSTTASNISGTAFEETTGDYGFRTTVQIQPGYYASATTVTKDFSSMLPAPATEGTAAQVLAGYDLYNHDGQLISGTMANNSIGTITLDQTTTSYTIPAGYHNGTGKVQHTTVNIPDPTITVSSAGLITASGSWTRGFTSDNSYSNTKQLTTQAGSTTSPTESEQTIVAAGTYVTGVIKVGAISSTYVGSGITSRSSTDLSASGATVTVPAGYYASQATKSVSTMTLPTSAAASATSGYTSKATISPSTSDQYINIPTGYNSAGAYYKINAMSTMTLPTSASASATSGYTSKATIGRSTSDQYINIPPGYNSAGAYYKISAVANGSATNSGTASGSSANLSTGTNTITLSKAVSITPTVTAGYVSTGTAGNVTVSLTASVTTKAAATITPGTTNQTIASGTYLTGTQTIAGDSDLIASNIKSGVTIFGVAGSYSGVDTSDATAAARDIVDGKTAYVNGSKITGSLVIQTYYTGTSAPSSSLGVNGDIYLQS